MNKVALITVASVVSAVIIGRLVFLGYVNSVYNDGVQYETRLSATYESNQNGLSQYITSFYEQMGIADLKSAKMDSILTNAVQGRYGEDGFSADGAFFSAVAEAYPDIQGLNVYDDIRAFIESGRASFKNDQDLLLDQLRSFEQWRRTGLIRHLVVNSVFPTNNLQARIGGKVVAEGEAALVQIRTLVLTEQGNEAFSTGTQEPLIGGKK